MGVGDFLLRICTTYLFTDFLYTTYKINNKLAYIRRISRKRALFTKTIIVQTLGIFSFVEPKYISYIHKSQAVRYTSRNGF